MTFAQYAKHCKRSVGDTLNQKITFFQKITLEKCESYEKRDFENVNSMKNNILKM